MFTPGPWIAAPTETAGETVFAIGDVHGCTPLLEAMLAGMTGLLPEAAGPARLVFLGDLIDRGPDGIGSLRRWAGPHPAFARVDRLLGNHEQMLLLAAEGDRAARDLWLSLNGETMLAELQAASGRPNAEPDAAMLEAALGAAVVAVLHGAASHVALGNLILVHGGIDPQAELAGFLAQPWRDLAARPRHWAWMKEGFLDWHGGFGGRIVVHGHTPPAKQHPLTGLDDPHVLHESRLNLDGGSAVTGIVAGAQIETGRYRVLRAGS
ncbi:metallophosphoesterase [Belnapia sp. T6]|uniref:Metallophosphoesterase n=1 Tax=Belnapia mucosa TaxID=2804532 RepID=A0ABS1UY61_9PROT|nr:metallophosphoesterase [Belnapia mucosa]MBL6454408.1 metallophosphoesterase [Belnapia mucosa]